MLRGRLAWGRKWARHGVVLFAALLTLYAASVVAIVLHELAHAAAYIFLGLGLKSVDIPLTRIQGLALPLRTAPRDAWVSMIGSTAAPGSQLLLGLLVLAGIYFSERFRASLFAITVVLVTLGGIGVDLLGMAFGGKSGAWRDLPSIALGIGIPLPALKWIGLIFGPIAMLAVATICGRALLRWVDGYLETTRYLDRLGILVVAGWAPIHIMSEILGWLTAVFAIPPPAGWPRQGGIGWGPWPMVLGTLIATALIALPRLSPPSGSPPERHGPLQRRFLLRSALLAVTAFALVLAVRWTLGPIRVRWNPSDLPTSDEVAAWVMPRKGNAKALLRAANWSYMAGRDAEGTAYVDQAARVAEDDAESLCRIASIYAARGRDREARGLIDRAETLRPDLPLIHAALAKLHENRREYREAAASWRRFAQLSSESRDPQMRLNGEQIEAVHARARRCERMAVEGAR